MKRFKPQDREEYLSILSLEVQTSKKGRYAMNTDWQLLLTESSFFPNAFELSDTTMYSPSLGIRRELTEQEKISAKKIVTELTDGGYS